MNRRESLGALVVLTVAATTGCGEGTRPTLDAPGNTRATLDATGALVDGDGTPAGRVHILDFYNPT